MKQKIEWVMVGNDAFAVRRAGHTVAMALWHDGKWRIVSRFWHTDATGSIDEIEEVKKLVEEKCLDDEGR